MRILIVLPRQDRATGNWVTARRFQRGLERYGHRLALCDTSLDPAPLARAVAAFDPELVVLLHAYRSGRPWLELARRPALPTLVVLTGTDVHQGLDDADQRPVIEALLARAAAVVVQNSLTAAALRRERPALAPRLHDLSPGVELGDAPYALRQLHGIDPHTFLFFCPASLRPVKGLLELLELFTPLARQRTDFHLACCGPVLDEDYGRQFQAALTGRPWASYLGVIPVAAMPAALAEVEVVINNSFSEGLPNALLEAVTLGRAILARDIPGNAAVVEAEVNGLLYADAAGFARGATRLLDEPGLLARLSRPTPGRYALDREALELERLCRLARTAG